MKILVDHEDDAVEVYEPSERFVRDIMKMQASQGSNDNPLNNLIEAPFDVKGANLRMELVFWNIHGCRLFIKWLEQSRYRRDMKDRSLEDEWHQPW